MTGKILIIDDEEKLRSLLKRIVSLEGYVVSEAGTLKAAFKFLDKETPDVILCDVKLPDGNAVDYVAEIKARSASTEIILLTAYGNIPDAIRSMKNGAFDYITKGDDNDRLLPLLTKAMEKVRLQKRILQLEGEVGKKYSFDSILGSSPLIQDVIGIAKKVSATDTTVLLQGETGTGKEVFAQAIHYNGKRSGKPFLALNCSAFGKELLESEIFGHKAGAFTGATKDKKGLVEEADTGTLFLDEIGEMNIDLQAKLLRVLETNEFLKVGDTRPTKVNVRFIAATNRDLQQEVLKGNFREDLFYRINVFTIFLPALRDRKKDIPVLANFFLQIFAAKINAKTKSISKVFMDHLQNHHWKGNIRELKNIIERSVILAENDELVVSSLPVEMQTLQDTSKTLSAFDMASVEKLHILRVLNHTKGNKTETAKLLNIGLTTLYRKIEEYNIS